MYKTNTLSKQIFSLRTCAIALLLITINISAFAQQSDRVTAMLPTIICLLICDEKPDTTSPTISPISSSISVSANSSITPILFTNSGGGNVTSCTVSPSLPAGLFVQISSDSNSCEIVGTPNATQVASSFTVTATNSFGSDDATIEITIEAEQITVSGQITYDLVPTASSPERLDYNAIVAKPVRGATIELLNSSSTVLQTSTTDELGNYSFDLTQDESVRIRVRAELLKTSGTSQHDVKIVDNTNSSALYTLVEASAVLASSKTNRNLHAPSGWDGSAYTSTRASGPFAILDSIYEAVIDFVAVDPNIILPPLVANWSVNNVAFLGEQTIGQIGTSFYTNGNIFILGEANNDTDEFDNHVIIHEWGHYFEDRLSRTDSIGGRHTISDRLDMRVAFGEGFGNALSGMITDDPLYIDTFGVGQSSGFTINVEENFNGVQQGWYVEGSVQSLLYDFYDASDDGADSISLGLGPIYNVLVNEQKDSDVFTSIFSFSSALKANNVAAAAGITSLLESQSIVGDTVDEIGSTETNNAGNTTAVLPVYTVLSNGVAENVCTTSDFGTRNKLSNFRYLTFNVVTPGTHTIMITKTSLDFRDTDPDIRVFQKGKLLFTGQSVVVNSETVSGSLSSGIHTLDLLEFNLFDGVVGEACFDVLITNN